jgi:hypothetical protein
MEHYKAEHSKLSNQDMITTWTRCLESQAWSDGVSLEAEAAKKAKNDMEIARKELRIISGADTFLIKLVE